VVGDTLQFLVSARPASAAGSEHQLYDVQLTPLHLQVRLGVLQVMGLRTPGIVRHFRISHGDL
jgi:hypothetical protein